MLSSTKTSKITSSTSGSCWWSTACCLPISVELIDSVSGSVISAPNSSFNSSIFISSWNFIAEPSSSATLCSNASAPSFSSSSGVSSVPYSWMIWPAILAILFCRFAVILSVKKAGSCEITSTRRFCSLTNSSTSRKPVFRDKVNKSRRLDFRLVNNSKSDCSASQENNASDDSSSSDSTSARETFLPMATSRSVIERSSRKSIPLRPDCNPRTYSSIVPTETAKASTKTGVAATVRFANAVNCSSVSCNSKPTFCSPNT